MSQTKDNICFIICDHIDKYRQQNLKNCIHIIYSIYQILVFCLPIVHSYPFTPKFKNNEMILGLAECLVDLTLDLKGINICGTLGQQGLVS